MASPHAAEPVVEYDYWLNGIVALITDVIDQWVRDAQSQNLATRQRAIEDIEAARTNPDSRSAAALRCASLILHKPYQELLSGLADRVRQEVQAEEQVTTTNAKT